MPEYNTKRNKLVIREYGRNIQKMIEDAILIEDRAQRNEAAKAIVKAMSFVNSSMENGTAPMPNNNNAQPDPQRQKERESLDFWQKLWDHLIIISDYRLEVDSPFEKPTKEDKPAVVAQHEEYHKGAIRVRSYGRYLNEMIRTVSEYPDGPEKEQLTKDIANQMKKLYLTWNRDTVDNELIISQLKELSKGKLTLPDDFEFATFTELPATDSPLAKAKKKKRKKKRKNVNSEKA